LVDKLTGAGSHLLAVAEEMHLARVVIGTRRRVEKRVQRGLAVDHHFPLAGQADHHVRTKARVFAVDADLLEEVALVAHARQLDEALERELAPLAARVRAPQGRYELIGLSAEHPLHFSERAELLAQHAVRLGAALFDVAEARLVLAEQFVERLE